jgi:hypothetical protein
MKHSLALASLALVILTSCSNSVDLAIDNPTQMDVTIKVDTLEVVIPPREVVWVEMGKGKHTITLQNDSTVEFDFTQDVYMVNPTLTEYLQYEQIYGDATSATMFSNMTAKTKVTYLGMELEGNYAVIKDLINPITWDYGPREALPEMVEMDEDERFTTLVKITDPIELIEETFPEGSESPEVEEIQADGDFNN